MRKSKALVWPEAHIKTLHRMYRAGKSSAEIGTVLNRPTASVSAKITAEIRGNRLERNAASVVKAKRLYKNRSQFEPLEKYDPKPIIDRRKEYRVPVKIYPPAFATGVWPERDARP